jgi:hypothetical protein
MKPTAETLKREAADSADLIWGGAKIAEFLNLPLTKFYHLNAIGAFGDAVARLSHKTLVGSKSALARLPERAAARADAANAANTITTE